MNRRRPGSADRFPAPYPRRPSHYRACGRRWRRGMSGSFQRTPPCSLPRESGRRYHLIPEAAYGVRHCSRIIDLGEMVAALQDDGAVPGEDALQARQPSQLDCTIQVAKDEQRRYAPNHTQALFQVSQVVMALRDAPEEVVRVAAHRPVEIGSPVGLLLSLGKVLLRLLRNVFERILQENVEVVAQKTENGRTHQSNHGI